MLYQHRTIKKLLAEYNKPRKLASYLIPFVGSRTEVMIADLGCGAFSKIGSYLEGVDLTIYHSDKQDFTAWWGKYGVTPIIAVEKQDMERLTYPDDFFDIVHCANALDHTRDVKSAVEEMIRVCKPGGDIIIICYLDQLETGHLHRWNAKEDGVLENKNEKVDLKQYGFRIDYKDNGGENRYNVFTAILTK